jgi:predicted Rossmann fold nucleotide-binding protein DprA/Smf involved in DNA uptake
MLRKVCDEILKKQKSIQVVSGMARGADQLGLDYANEKGLKVYCFPADWEKHGKKAGYIRNQQMADFADALIAFWDGQSPGTKMMIDLAEKQGLQIKVYNYGENGRSNRDQ